MVSQIHLFLIAATCIISIYANHFDSYPDSNQLSFDPDVDVESGFKPRIINPIVPGSHSLPFMAFISIRVNNYAKYCAGTIIAHKYVMTALHCLTHAVRDLNVLTYQVEKLMTVRVGSQYKTKGGATYGVVESFKTNNTLAYKEENIVILELKHNIFVAGAKPIKLGAWKPKVGTRLKIAGYTRVVNGARKSIDQYAIGNATVFALPPCEGKPYAFCVRDVNQGASVGDEGGPAYMLVKGEYIQVGMILDDDPKKNTDQRVLSSGAYLLIRPFCGFIAAVTKGLARCKAIN
uniref:Peptidase S1 domain-containing protein n=1 Tax=Panagrellus redivivus TaxID=6233 RepID=A0A7E4VQA0_PANRE